MRVSFPQEHSLAAASIILRSSALAAMRRARSAPVAADSALLFANTILSALFGVVFWAVAAQLYDISAVGLTSAVVSAATLVATFANLGLSAVVVRFLPVAGQRGRLLSVLACLVPGLMALVVAPALALLPATRDLLGATHGGDVLQLSLLALMSVAMAVSFVQDSVFIARRQAGLVLFRGVCAIVVRFAALVPLVSYGATGLVGAYLAGALAMLTFGAVAWKRHADTTINIPLSLKEVAQYGGTNYLGGLFSQAPQLLYPILIATQVSHAAAGAFAFVWMPVAMLMTLPASVANVLMSQVVCSPGDAARRIKRATWALAGTIAALAVALFVGVSLFAQLVLPRSADNIVAFLPIMLTGSVFFAIVRLNSMELAYRGRLRTLVVVNGLSALAATALPVVLLPSFGVLGLECGWLLSQVFAVILGSVVLARYSREGCPDV